MADSRDRDLAAEFAALVARWAPEGSVPVRPGRLAVFAELEEVRAAWSGLWAHFPIARLADRFVNSGWNLRDALGHLGAWTAETRRQVETAARGDRFDYAIPFALSLIGPNEWNRAEVEKRRPLALDEIRGEFEAEAAALQDLVLSMPSEMLFSESDFPLAPSGDPATRFRSFPAQIVQAQCLHLQYHLRRLERFLARAPA